MIFSSKILHILVNKHMHNEYVCNHKNLQKTHFYFLFVSLVIMLIHDGGGFVALFQVWDLRNLCRKFTLPDHKDSVSCLQFNRDFL